MHNSNTTTKWQGKSKGTVLGYRIFVFLMRHLGIYAAYSLLIFVAFYQEKGKNGGDDVYKAWKIDALVKISQMDTVDESINFELIDIDGYDTLFTELLEDGTYATVSDDDGYMLEDLETPIVFNVYDDNDSFQWSVTLDDSYQLKDLLDGAESTDAFLATLQKLRQEHIEQYQ